MWSLLLAAVLAPQGTPAPQPATAPCPYTAPHATPPPRDDHPVDAFLDTTLARQGLPTLLRFLADTRADAWERAVDGLLAPPHSLERQALLWLDLARHGDTNGFHFDSPRAIWTWRDLLIDLQNRDAPSREQCTVLRQRTNTPLQALPGLSTSRRPGTEELGVLAAALAAEPEAQRWTLVANARLHLDETLSR